MQSCGLRKNNELIILQVSHHQTEYSWVKRTFTHSNCSLAAHPQRCAITRAACFSDTLTISDQLKAIIMATVELLHKYLGTHDKNSRKGNPCDLTVLVIQREKVRQKTKQQQGSPPSNEGKEDNTMYVGIYVKSLIFNVLTFIISIFLTFMC